MPPLYVSMRVAGLEQIKCNTPGAGEKGYLPCGTKCRKVDLIHRNKTMGRFGDLLSLSLPFCVK